ncbi:MAG: hypothetical protein M3P29_12100 [Acidobacteriota bacterium]|nr:hypothetical protein [Acidobacteriota bacterium]
MSCWDTIAAQKSSFTSGIRQTFLPFGDPALRVRAAVARVMATMKEAGSERSKRGAPAHGFVQA